MLLMNHLGNISSIVYNVHSIFRLTVFQGPDREEHPHPTCVEPGWNPLPLHWGECQLQRPTHTKVASNSVPYSLILLSLFPPSKTNWIKVQEAAMVLEEQPGKVKFVEDKSFLYSSFRCARPCDCSCKGKASAWSSENPTFAECYPNVSDMCIEHIFGTICVSPSLVN